MKLNYQRLLDEKLSKIKETGARPRLLLHSCCAPCSSHVIEYLSSYFDITVYFYNPNIHPEDEYGKRAIEQKEFIERFPPAQSVLFAEGEYDAERFFELSRGLENEPEKGERCTVCFKMRLEKAAQYAFEHGFDYFTTTLSISPHKDATLLNELGEEIEKEKGVEYLHSDFKKKNGYKRSSELSSEYGLYRQDYCGCVFSRLESDKRNSMNNKPE
ncbi:epoxyqueuosine reductase QueH [Peptoclostridium sp.]|uniref:epoxyqueuosine reductase QueH n=1 Tax=Peptoclostridium sp. TaxID=1904860 RepID=UPI002ED46C79